MKLDEVGGDGNIQARACGIIAAYPYNISHVCEQHDNIDVCIFEPYDAAMHISSTSDAAVLYI